MLRTALVGLTALFITGSTLAYAETPAERAQELLKSVDWKGLTEARIDVIKAALQLTPEQEKLWPPVEEAMMARAQARYARLEAMAKPRTERRDALELMQARANNMAERAAELKKLSEAWQPLYETLDAKQKQRMRVLGMYVLHEMRDAVQTRHMQRAEEDLGEED